MRRPRRPDQLRTGHRVRDFRVVRRLGVGGFAFVFLMEREGQRYTMKMAARPASEKDPDQVDAWMRREVSSLEHLRHPHLLPVLEWGRWPEPETGYGYYVTPYISGSTFHVWRWRERAPLDRVVGVLCEQLKTLEALHEDKIVHRDVKADNLLVRQGDDTPFLIDFGTAHLPWARVLTEGLAPGTLYCQPPEAILFLASLLSEKPPPPGSRLEARPTADLYAFGVLLYEALTNCHPFSTRLPLDELLPTIASTPPVEPGQLAPEIPASLGALALRLLAKDPGQRPQNARAVREELERLREQEGRSTPWQAPAKRPSECAWVRERFPDVDMLEESPELELSAARELRPGETARMRSRWPVRLVTLAIGLGLLGIGWALLRLTRAPPREDGPRAEATAPAPPAPPEKGTQPVPSSPSETPPASSESTPSRLCSVLTRLLGGVAAAQLAGCVTTPTRPDPASYLAQCPPEAIATPVKLGFDSRENATFLETGTPASNDPIEEGGSMNVKPGPVTATMFAEVKGKEVETKVTGMAVTTPNRLYIQFDQMQLPDGTWWPICGVAVDDFTSYGVPTHAKEPIPGSVVDPAKVDKSPGNVVLNDPRFETVLQYPKGHPMPRLTTAPPDWL
ncbi:protein kinase domain-containing protein [Archangium lansingense]|uniref:Protein kinase n=1 Tax=Archangium lansingense TaxID=2995310 RepID=A0ABT4APU5_9BACT|nr:protein kinase [Archangium lansinium]MCY1083716.1 protein kinase [Archangium lansinium]